MQTLTKKIAVVGATGAVGRVFLDLLNEFFPGEKELYLLASERSQGVELACGSQVFKVSDLSKFDFSEVDLDKATEYAAEDADVTLRLYEILSDKIETEKLNKIYEIFEKPMIKILSKLEIQGIKVDASYLKKLSKKQDKFVFK